MSGKPPVPSARPACPDFADEYRAHHQALLGLAALLTGDQRAADAVVSDAFVALHSAWRAVGSGERAQRYLLRLVIIRSRRAARRTTGHDHPDAQGLAHPKVRGETQLPGQAGAMMAMLQGMSQHQREAIALRYYLDLSEDHAAAVMGVRKAAFRRLLAQALTVLGPGLPTKP